MKTKEFPVSILEVIEKEMGYNASIRSISVLIPFDSVKFGRNCIELHNDIIRKIYNNPKMKLGSQIVGNRSTQQILEKKGLAGPLKTFAFLTQKGAKSAGNSTAWDLKSSVGEYVKQNHKGTGVSVYGVSAMNGYHSMLLTYRTRGGASEFSLLDQGPATSLITGRSTYHTASEFDSSLEEYVRDRQGKRTKGGYEYPSNIQIYRLFPSKGK